MKISVTIQDDPLVAVLKAIDHEVQKPKEMLTFLGEVLLPLNQDRHRDGKDPKGDDWQELAASTKKEKRKGGPLNKTSEMLDSLNYQVSDNELLLGFDGERNNKLASIHHNGSDPYLIEPLNKKALYFNGVFAKKVNHPGIPKRELLAVYENDEAVIEQAAEDYLTAVLNAV